MKYFSINEKKYILPFADHILMDLIEENVLIIYFQFLLHETKARDARTTAQL